MPVYVNPDRLIIGREVHAPYLVDAETRFLAVIAGVDGFVGFTSHELMQGSSRSRRPDGQLFLNDLPSKVETILRTETAQREYDCRTLEGHVAMPRQRQGPPRLNVRLNLEDAAELIAERERIEYLVAPGSIGRGYGDEIYFSLGKLLVSDFQAYFASEADALTAFDAALPAAVHIGPLQELPNQI